MARTIKPIDQDFAQFLADCGIPADELASLDEEEEEEDEEEEMVKAAPSGRRSTIVSNRPGFMRKGDVRLMKSDPQGYLLQKGIELDGRFEEFSPEEKALLGKLTADWLFDDSYIAAQQADVDLANAYADGLRKGRIVNDTDQGDIINKKW